MGCYRRNAYPYEKYVKTYERCWAKLNPFISNKVFEVFVSMKQISSLNFAKLNTIFRYREFPKHVGPAGVVAEDPLHQSRFSVL